MQTTGPMKRRKLETNAEFKAKALDLSGLRLPKAILRDHVLAKKAVGTLAAALLHKSIVTTSLDLWKVRGGVLIGHSQGWGVVWADRCQRRGC